MKKRHLIIAVVVAGLIFVRGVALGDTFPSKPINLWVGAGPGGGTDLVARAVANIASKTLKQPIVVTNVPGGVGGGGTLSLAKLKTEKPDGYSIAHGASPAVTRVPHLQPVPFNAQEPLKDFMPIISVFDYYFGIVVKKDSPWKTLEEFIAYAKANPGKIRYSTSGALTTMQLFMDYLAMKENIKWTHVPFTASSQVVLAVLGGHVEAASLTPEWKEQVDAGEMRLLFLGTGTKLPFYPNVPTFKDKGYDFAYRSLFVIWAPSQTPKEVVSILTKAFRPAAETDEVKQLLSRLNLISNVMEGEELVPVIKEDYEFNRRFIKELGIGIYKKN